MAFKGPFQPKWSFLIKGCSEWHIFRHGTSSQLKLFLHHFFNIVKTFMWPNNQIFSDCIFSSPLIQEMCDFHSRQILSIVISYILCKSLSFKYAAFLVFYNILMIFPLHICCVESKHENWLFYSICTTRELELFKEVKSSRPKRQ